MRLTRTDAACNTMPSLRDELVNDRMQTKEWRQKIGWIKQMASSCYMDSINVVNDIGGSISPNGTDQFPPFMSCILWEIFWLKGSTWEIMRNTRVSCTHCDTSAWTWRVWWNDAIDSSGSKYLWKNMINANASKHSVNYFLALDDETQQTYFSFSVFNSFIMTWCWLSKYLVASRNFKMATSSATFWLKMDSSSFSSVWLFA